MGVRYWRSDTAGSPEFADRTEIFGHGKSKVGRKSDCGKQRVHRSGRESVFSRRGCEGRISEAEPAHDGVPVEGNRALLPRGSGRDEKRERGVVLPSAETRGGGNQGLHCVLE